jgi:hypothetical protein
MNTKKYISGALALATVAGLVFALPLFADTTVAAPPVTGQTWTRGIGVHEGIGMMRSGVVGTVSANDGSTLTITVKKFSKPVTGVTTPVAPTTVTYTITTTGATTVTKAGVASTVSGIAVGDTVAVQGTITGTTVAATSIRDGVMKRGGQGGNSGKGAGMGSNANSAANLVAGNGQPIVGGAVAAISGNTLTVTNKSNITYVVDATSAKFLQGSTTISISNVNVGDTVIVQGTVNGTNVTASTVIDQTKPAGTTTTNPGKHFGFFGGIGNFFAHLFGF